MWNNNSGFGSSGSYQSYNYQQAPAKKSKKVAIIIIALIMIGIGVACYFGIRYMSRSTAYNSFNIYANYILSGEELATAPEGEYAPTDSYKIDTIQDSPQTEKDSYFENADKLLDDFFDKFKAISKDANPDLQEKINKHIESFDFIKTYANTANITEDALFSRYIVDGASVSKKYIEDTYSPLIQSDNYYINYYGVFQSKYYSVMVDTFDYLKEKGCIISGSISKDCVNKTPLIEPLAKNYNRVVVEKIDNIDGMAKDVIKGIAKDCWLLSEELR